MSAWARSYHRRSTGRVHTLLHPSYECAVRDASERFADDDVDRAWVRKKRDHGFGPVIYQLETHPGGCWQCGWPPGMGHAPGAACEDGGAANGLSELQLISERT
jgi:hypothetical protein